MTFLEQVAKALLAEHGTGLREVAVVLPSQRAGSYLRDQLAREAGSALWSPEIFTISTWMEHLSGLRPLPAEELLFEAYEAYRSVETTAPDDLNEFLQWAPTALHDISEADAHLLPLDGFYRDLRSWEELDWSFNDTPLSGGQERMVRYWAVKGKLHLALNTRLLAQGAGTQGLVERTAAEGTHAVAWKAVWFAGLNALTPAQERVLAAARDQGVARILWDPDRYYLDDPRQEAGAHLRKAIGRFGPGLLPPQEHLASGRLELDVLRAPNEVAQAWCAAQLVSESSVDQRTRTAIVLADESLLQPLLEALPADIGPLNVTMGLPIALLPVGSYLSALHQLHTGCRAGAGFFHADVERFLGHPFLQHGSGARSILKALEGSKGSKTAFITEAWIKAAVEQLPAPLNTYAAQVFSPVSSVRTDMPGITTSAIGWAARATANDAFSTEQLYQAALVLERTHSLLERYEHPLDANSYALILRKLLRSARIGLFGEPLAGLQVMGMLEARALDPERIILLGAQEGALPSGGSDRSFIPFELRRAHGLPLRDSTDAVQGYNFLRMLQRASQVTLIHPEHAESGGPSRFILQLDHELFHASSAAMPKTSARIRVPVRARSAVGVKKSEKVLAATRALLEKGLSPTALGNWLRCPLDFYFRNILRLRENEVAEARIASNILGDALHASVESIYRPWLNNALAADELLMAADAMSDVLENELSKRVPRTSLLNGQPLLQANMATHAGERFLRHEADVVRQGMNIVPLGLEVPVEARLTGAEEIIGSPVLLHGRLDRIDRRDGLAHILDLKTGRVDPASLNISELTLDALKGDKRYAAQLLVYAWMHLATNPDVPVVQAGLLPLQRSSSSTGIYVRVGGEALITRGMMPALEEVFTEAIVAILDPSTPIMHDPGSKYCRFCVV